jgi:hypothetical protein
MPIDRHRAVPDAEIELAPERLECPHRAQYAIALIEPHAAVRAIGIEAVGQIECRIVGDRPDINVTMQSLLCGAADARAW